MSFCLGDDGGCKAGERGRLCCQTDVETGLWFLVTLLKVIIDNMCVFHHVLGGQNPDSGGGVRVET